MRPGELKDRFIREFSLPERAFFLKKARDAVFLKGYPAGEDLYQYCYYLTLRERLRGIDIHGGPGYMKLLFAEGLKDVDDAIRLYEERLEQRKQPSPDVEAAEFIRYLGD